MTPAGHAGMPLARARALLLVFVLLMSALGTNLLSAPPASAATFVRAGFQVSTVFQGLNQPTAMVFAPDGRIFVTEKGGVIKAFDSTADSTATVVADLSRNVHAVADRGMLGLAVDPQFTSGRPYLYITYMVDAPPGGTPPVYNDECLRDPATNAWDNCPATGRLSRIQVGADSRMVGSETILIGAPGDNYWCHQAQAHAIDHVAFGPDGALYISAGEGAGALVQDYGQQTAKPNACGDPPGPVGTPLTLPSSEGGSLRAQDLLTPADPAQGSGAIIRVNPQTGAAAAGNPLIGGSSPTDDRHIAFGLRNPFRFTFRPGTSEIWVGDVGWNSWDEVNRIMNPTDATLENFGWPCYEGNGKQLRWDESNATLCEELYAGTRGPVVQPYWTYGRNTSPDAANCGNQGAAVSGVAFSEGSPFPSAYNGALFVADYAKGCIWALTAGSNGLPLGSNLQTIVGGVAPVDLEIGPDKALYFADILAGTIERVTFFSGNQPPIARATATPSSGPVPLAVSFSGSGSTDDGPLNQLSYAWDLDGDGAYDDATGVTASRTYSTPGSVRVGLRVTDGGGLSGTTTVTVNAGSTPPTATITAPTTATRWASGDSISFSGSGSDAEDGALPAASMRWAIILQHCQTATDCHAHPQVERIGVSSGSFNAPQHSYPSYLEFRLTVTDSSGLTASDSVRVDPRTVDLTFRTVPAGLELLADTAQGPSPLTVRVITGSAISVTAPAPQTVGGVTYDFTGWSDGGAASHDVLAGTTNATYTASYQARPDKTVDRQWGPNRYATAATISASTFDPGVDVVYVATGADFPDALAAGAAAAKGGGPVLLVKPGSIPPETATELGRLDPDQIIIAGSSDVVSSAVEQGLREYSPNVTRQFGPDRYATAVDVSKKTFGAGVPVVYVATGADFADALAAMPAAAFGGGPVLLVRKDEIPAVVRVELDRLNPQRIVIAGGSSVVSATVATQLTAYAPSVSRQWGTDRYATAAAISRATPFPVGSDVAYIATGLDFADAAAAGAAAAARGGPVLLVKTESIPPPTDIEIDRLQPDQMIIAGSTAVVSSGVEVQLAQK